MLVVVTKENIFFLEAVYRRRFQTAMSKRYPNVWILARGLFRLMGYTAKKTDFDAFTTGLQALSRTPHGLGHYRH